MKWLHILRAVMQCLSICILIGALGLTITALITTSWQTVDIEENKVEHLHGLWQDCVKGERIDQHSEWKCSIKMFFKSAEEKKSADKKSGDRHDAEEWRFIVICLIVSSIVIGLIGLVFSFCSSCYKCCAVTWTLLTGFAMLTLASSLIIFYRYANEHRRFLADLIVYEQDLGISFWYAVGGCCAFLGSTLFSILTTALIFLNSKIAANASRTFPKEIAL